MASTAVHALLFISLGWVAIDQVVKPSYGSLDVVLEPPAVEADISTLDESPLEMGMTREIGTPHAGQIAESLDSHIVEAAAGNCRIFVARRTGDRPDGQWSVVVGRSGRADGPGQELAGAVEVPTADGDKPMLGKGVASFYGAEAKGYRFVYIVDASRSMLGPRFIKACSELFNSITALDQYQSFYVIFFNTEDVPQFWPEVAKDFAAQPGIA